MVARQFCLLLPLRVLGLGTLGQINSLTGLRFFAALAVLLGHAGGIAPLSNWLAGPILAQGVSFFFILSGFVLAFAHDRQPKALQDYALARVARIYPLYVAALAIALLLSGSLPRWEQMPEFVLLHDWPLKQVPHILGPGWSLSAEAFFYALFPFLIVGNRPFIALIASLIFLALLFAMPGIIDPGLFYLHPIIRLPEFLFGVVLYRVSCAWRPSDSDRLAWTVVEIGVLIAAFELSSLSRQWHAALEPNSPLQFYVLGSAAAPAFALCILVFSWQAGWLSRLIGCAPMVLLGHSSYALYLIHVPILTLLPQSTTAYYGQLSSPEKLLFYCVVVSSLVAFSIALHILIERPAQKWLLSIRKQPSGLAAS